MLFGYEQLLAASQANSFLAAAAAAVANNNGSQGRNGANANGDAPLNLSKQKNDFEKYVHGYFQELTNQGEFNQSWKIKR